jgi:hypothetical protein
MRINNYIAMPPLGVDYNHVLAPLALSPRTHIRHACPTAEGGVGGAGEAGQRGLRGGVRGVLENQYGLHE